MIDQSGLFSDADEPQRRVIRLALFLSFSYIGMVLAMRSNKEDFSLIIPYVRFAPQSKPENLLLLDTSVIIDGRIADLIEANFIEGMLVVPRFVLTRTAANRRFQRPGHPRPRPPRIGDAHPPAAEQAQRGENPRRRFSRGNGSGCQTGAPGRSALGAKLYTNDYNLGKVAELQSVPYVNLNELANALKPVILPGEVFTLRVVREGKDKGQGVGYLNDGTMVVINNAQSLIGQQVTVKVLSLLANRRRRHHLCRFDLADGGLTRPRPFYLYGICHGFQRL